MSKSELKRKIDFNALFSARYVTKAVPQMVDYHDLKEPITNQESVIDAHNFHASLVKKAVEYEFLY